MNFLIHVNLFLIVHYIFHCLVLFHKLRSQLFFISMFRLLNNFVQHSNLQPVW